MYVYVYILGSRRLLCWRKEPRKSCMTWARRCKCCCSALLLLLCYILFSLYLHMNIHVYEYFHAILSHKCVCVYMCIHQRCWMLCPLSIVLYTGKAVCSLLLILLLAIYNIYYSLLLCAVWRVLFFIVDMIMIMMTMWPLCRDAVHYISLYWSRRSSSFVYYRSPLFIIPAGCLLIRYRFVGRRSLVFASENKKPRGRHRNSHAPEADASGVRRATQYLVSLIKHFLIIIISSIFLESVVDNYFSTT